MSVYVGAMRAALFVVMVACGSHIEAKKPTTTPVMDAGASWDGEGCATLGSRTQELDIANAVVDGDLHKGRQHCYLDLQRALCVRFPSEDGGVDEVYVRTLRLADTCESQPEVRLRGSVHGVVETLGPMHEQDWTVDAKATSLERAKHAVGIELGDAGAARKELLESFVLRCWRNASVASGNVEGHLAFGVVVAASGDVTDVRKRESVAASDAFAACVDKSLRAPQMFVAADAGASHEVSVRVTFSVAVSPL
jgi:hypothetical protein